MGTSTGQNLVDSIKDHIGNRNTGRIGSRGVDDAMLDSVNKGIRSILKRYNPPDLQEKLTVSVSSSTNAYDYPTSTDTNGNTIYIKTFLDIVIQQISETTGHLLTEVFVHTQDSIEPYMDGSNTGRPFQFSKYNDQILLYPWPDDDYNMYMRCNMWPANLTLGAYSPLADAWDDVVISYAVYNIFAKLQQTKDADIWYKNYLLSYRETVGMFRKNSGMIVDASQRDLVDMGSALSSNPALDPFSKKGY